MQPTLRVLHVEDDELDAELIHDMVLSNSRNRKMTIDHVVSLRDALNTIEKDQYQAVLLDLNLDDVCGLDNVRAIHAQQPDLPIVVLSALDCDETAVQAIEEGAQEYLVKGHSNSKVVSLALHSSIKRKAAERELYRRANYDALTDLINRGLFIEHTQSALRRAVRWDKHVAIMFIDLDHFKAVNDMHGHEAGNHALIEVSRRLKMVLRQTDIIARYGGDEFLVLLDEGDEKIFETAGQVAVKIQDALNADFWYDDHMIELVASIGIAISPFAGIEAGQLIDRADKAMYKAKQMGGRHFSFAALN